MPVHFPEIKATFIHVPKTGGTSFYNWISENVNTYIQLPDNNYATGSINGATELWGDLGTTMSFVRNPYSRLVSMYEYQYAKAQLLVSTYKPGTNMSDSLLDHLRLIALCKRGFEYWVKCVCTDSPEIYSIYDGNPNQISVSSWFNGTIPDVVVKTESLNTDFYKVRDVIAPGNTTPLPWDNVTQHRPYRDYYNDETKKLVAMKFKDDLDNFNYDF
jgi:hypothetical protein